MSEPNPNLIFDIGTAEGNDTWFYLEKGFDVIGVEADPVAFAGYTRRFSKEIIEGRLVALNNAATLEAGLELEFWRNDKHQRLSSLRKSPRPKYADIQTAYKVKSIDWSSLIDIKGVPHFAKIDIEGGEIDFLSGMTNLPTYISAESKSVDVLDSLITLGYDNFRIVDQSATKLFVPPNPPLEGRYVENNNSDHGSGLFGRDLPGRRWLSGEEARRALDTLLMLQRERTIRPTWYDCHGWIGR